MIEIIIDETKDLSNLLNDINESLKEKPVGAIVEIRKITDLDMQAWAVQICPFGTIILEPLTYLAENIFIMWKGKTFEATWSEKHKNIELVMQ